MQGIPLYDGVERSTFYLGLWPAADRFEKGIDKAVLTLCNFNLEIRWSLTGWDNYFYFLQLLWKNTYF